MEVNGTNSVRQETEKAPANLDDVCLESQDTTDNSVQFRQVPLDESGERPKQKKQKVPRRILHFSDGVLEEYSTDEEEENKQEVPPVNPKTLKWVPWFWYYVTLSAAKTLNVADFCGEKLAWFFGITSPKYQFAIDEYNRIKAEDQREKEEEEREREAERRRIAEAMAGMEGAVNTTQAGTGAAEYGTRSESQPSSDPTNTTRVTLAHEKY